MMNVSLAQIEDFNTVVLSEAYCLIEGFRDSVKEVRIHPSLWGKVSTVFTSLDGWCGTLWGAAIIQDDTMDVNTILLIGEGGFYQSTITFQTVDYQVSDFL